MNTSTWSGFRAYTLESERMRVVMIPELGAKIVSLYDKHHAYEWLSPPTRPLSPVTYGARFTDADLSGWDEMYPTIDACPYPVQGRYHGAALPDHGEIWALPWEVTPEGESLVCQVDGIALPYTFRRMMRLDAPDTLTLRYHVTNNSDETLIGLWAAHPLFRADAQTQVILPPDVTHVVNVTDDARFGGVGAPLIWAEHTTPDGETIALDRIGAASRHDSRKYYLPSDKRITWASLKHGDASLMMRLDTSPFLGIWVDEGKYTRESTVALEPSDGYYDSLETAHTNGLVSAIPAHSAREWQLSLTLA